MKTSIHVAAYGNVIYRTVRPAFGSVMIDMTEARACVECSRMNLRKDKSDTRTTRFRRLLTVITLLLLFHEPHAASQEEMAPRSKSIRKIS
ncbi:MAG: hypothetical protein WD425_06360 [Nitrospirales bacterium]